MVKQLQNVKNCVIASRDKVSAWQSNELHSNSSTLISVVTDLSAIISGSLKECTVKQIHNLEFYELKK